MEILKLYSVKLVTQKEDFVIHFNVLDVSKYSFLLILKGFAEHFHLQSNPTFKSV